MTPHEFANANTSTRRKIRTLEVSTKRKKKTIAIIVEIILSRRGGGGGPREALLAGREGGRETDLPALDQERKAETHLTPGKRDGGRGRRAQYRKSPEGYPPPAQPEISGMGHRLWAILNQLEPSRTVSTPGNHLHQE